jgi:hypothetical protein
MTTLRFAATLQIIALGLSVSACIAAEPDRWKGLILNETTPQQAIQVLGTPKKDETGTIDKLVRAKMFGSSGSGAFVWARRTDVVRMVLYENLEDFETVSLMFKDDTLAMIHLMPNKNNKIAAKDFEALYETAAFRTVYANQDFWNQDYLIDQGTRTLRPKTFPDTYWLIGMKKPAASTFVIGTVLNFPGWGRMLAQGLGAADPNVPGLIGAIDLMSTALLPPKPTNKSLQ